MKTIAIEKTLLNQLTIPNVNILSDKILAGGQPTIDDLKQLKQHQFSTVINLCAAHEPCEFNEIEAVKNIGMEYISIPISSVADLNLKHARQLHEAVSDKDGFVFVHCGSSDRVGALFALTSYFLEEKTVDEAIYFGKKAGLLKLESVVEQMLT